MIKPKPLSDEIPDTRNALSYASFKLYNLSGLNSRWYGPDSPSMRKPISEPNFTTYTDDSFHYQFNSHGYRCDEFTDTKAPKILFGGCSITAGVGLPNEDVWSYRIKRKVEEELGISIPYYSIAHGGKSAQYLARTLYLGMDIIKPDMVIMLLPDPFRREFLDNGIMHDIVPQYMDVLPKNIATSMLTLLTDEQVYHEFLGSLAFIHTLCQARAIPILWDCWAIHDRNDRLFRQMGGVRFKSTRRRIFIGGPNKQDLARDGLHAGPSAHEYMADQFWDSSRLDILEACNTPRWNNNEETNSSTQ